MSRLPDTYAHPYAPDRGTGTVVLGAIALVGGLVLVAVVGAPLAESAIASLGVLAFGASGIVVGLRRRAASARVGAEWPPYVSTTPLPREPLRYMSDPHRLGGYLKEPALMATFGLAILAIPLTTVFTTTGEQRIAAGVFCAVVGAFTAFMLAAATARARWMRAYKDLAGHLPW